MQRATRSVRDATTSHGTPSAVPEHCFPQRSRARRFQISRCGRLLQHAIEVATRDAEAPGLDRASRAELVEATRALRTALSR